MWKRNKSDDGRVVMANARGVPSRSLSPSPARHESTAARMEIQLPLLATVNFVCERA